MDNNTNINVEEQVAEVSTEVAETAAKAANGVDWKSVGIIGGTAVGIAAVIYTGCSLGKKVINKIKAGKEDSDGSEKPKKKLFGKKKAEAPKQDDESESKESSEK